MIMKRNETYKQRQGKQQNIRFTKEEAKKNFTEYIQHMPIHLGQLA